MAKIFVEKSKTICGFSQPLTTLYLIVQGRVKVQCPGNSYQIDSGDVAGICEICSDIHFLTYTALEDTTLMTYPVNSLEALEDLMQKRPNIAKLFLLSLFRQFGAMMEQASVSEVNSAELYRRLRTDCELYAGLCDKYKLPSRIPAEVEEIPPCVEDSCDEWLGKYYVALRRVYMGADSDVLLQEQGLSLGMLRKGSLDINKNYRILEAQAQYRAQIISCYFSQSGNDMFDAMTKLYYRLSQEGQDTDELYESISQMLRLTEEYDIPDETQARPRAEAFRRKEDALAHPEAAQGTGDGSDTDILNLLEGSLDTILDFAGLAGDKEASFREHVALYRATRDKNSTNDECSRLRRILTEEFYLLYSEVFERSLSVPGLPLPVRMFLYFGYVDENLAGEDNSVALYRLAGYMSDPGLNGVYTFYDWLLAVYDGKKNPSRSELDEDYDDFINQQKKKNNLTASQVAALENDRMAKVRYELENLFPVANKVTFGRVTTFCPLFTAENMLKSPRDSFITPDKIGSALSMLKKIDFSAFFRETIDYEMSQAMNREPMHVEYLPDIILMPNAGVRGSLWQEIEGRRRSSPSRMILPIFYLDNLETAVIRMTGEFRWEMCKRIQGGRWNDVSEPSLTSEYFDYLQFYRKNTELSKDAKEKLQNSLTRAKNSFREMFVRDYITWILYESSGSSRLNKVARRILFLYCPLPASMDKSLEQNPMFSELMNRQRILATQRLQKLGILRQKLVSGKMAVPDCLEQEIAFAKRMPETGSESL
ncbi:MAG: Crp/Fnr family transcriptional regulator [Lachnospiraceae bacterium]|nr:Crp/Fnr family transcriptional regulator [Lachnospiraceae bacterium]